MSSKEESANIEIIIEQLRRLQNGANIHTINKAVSYLRTLSGPVWYIKDDEKREKAFANHVANCKAAIRDQSVAILTITMRQWF